MTWNFQVGNKEFSNFSDSNYFQIVKWFELAPLQIFSHFGVRRFLPFRFLTFRIFLNDLQYQNHYDFVRGPYSTYRKSREFLR